MRCSPGMVFSPGSHCPYKVDVYHAHDLPQLPAATLAAAYHGASVIHDAHEWYPYQGFTDRQLVDRL